MSLPNRLLWTGLNSFCERWPVSQTWCCTKFTNGLSDTSGADMGGRGVLQSVPWVGFWVQRSWYDFSWCARLCYLLLWQSYVLDRFGGLCCSVGSVFLRVRVWLWVFSLLFLLCSFYIITPTHKYWRTLQLVCSWFMSAIRYVLLPSFSSRGNSGCWWDMFEASKGLSSWMCRGHWDIILIFKSPVLDDWPTCHEHVLRSLCTLLCIPSSRPH